MKLEIFLLGRLCKMISDAHPQLSMSQEGKVYMSQVKSNGQFHSQKWALINPTLYIFPPVMCSIRLHCF
jgi:hypothetical protein